MQTWLRKLGHQFAFDLPVPAPPRFDGGVLFPNMALVMRNEESRGQTIAKLSARNQQPRRA